MTHFPSPQGQEHLDHVAGAESELMLACHEGEGALAARNAAHAEKIEAVVAAGRFAVVVEYTAYCKATDGILGTERELERDCASREEASAAVEELCARAGESGEACYHVLPALPVPAVEPPSDDSSSVPF